MIYTRRDWIVQRLAGVAAGGDEWEDFRPSCARIRRTRPDMESAIERLTLERPAEEFRGHNIAYCDCHAMGFKRVTKWA